MSERSKQVFSLRKDGQLEQAYELAHLALKEGDRDEWLFVALGWVLIDLIKSPNLDLQQKQQYVQELKPINVQNEIFQKNKERVLHFSSPAGQLISQAKQLSDEHRHQDAVDCYLKALRMEPESLQINLGLGWQYYYLCSNEFKQEHPDTIAVKQYLNGYYRLPVHEAPGALHSQMLRMAYKLHQNDKSKLNLYKFLAWWNIENFQPSDSQQYETEKGKQLPSLKESVLLNAAKDLIGMPNFEFDEVVAMINQLRAASREFPDNIWFGWDISKLYLKIGNREDSLDEALKVARTKNREYWVWELIGDIHQQSDTLEPIVFYAKALTLQNNLDFICNLKVKFAKELIKKELFAQAQCELLAVQSHGAKLSQVTKELLNQSWMQEEVTVTDNTDLYHELAQKSDEVLFADIPWKRACLGESFVHSKTHKSNYRIYLEDNFLLIECLLEQSRYPFNRTTPGTPIYVKAIQEKGRAIQIVASKLDEESAPWSVFSEYIGAVCNISTKNKSFVWVVNRQINGSNDLDVLPKTPNLGMPLKLRVAQFHTKNGMKQKAITAELTESSAEEAIRSFSYESFTDCDQFAFTNSDIFIPPELWNGIHADEDSDTLSGTAVLSFNKKKNNWSWKAFEVSVDQITD